MTCMNVAKTILVAFACSCCNLDPQLMAVMGRGL